MKVRPKTVILTDRGTIWEERLFQAGWNELSPEDKWGKISTMGRMEDGTPLFTVFWPALGKYSKGIFADELTKFATIS
jgi:hypothetical protein